METSSDKNWMEKHPKLGSDMPRCYWREVNSPYAETANVNLNCGKHLKEPLASVLAQTYARAITSSPTMPKKYMAPVWLKTVPIARAKSETCMKIACHRKIVKLKYPFFE